jgi:hypothetical protein
VKANVIGVTVSMVFRFAFAVPSALSTAPFGVPNWSPIRLGYLFARSPLRLGRNRGGYRHNLDRIRRGRRNAGRGVRRCTSESASGTAFTFREPVAGLLSRGVQAAIHGKGPFWASFDGSHVDGSGAVSPPASSAYTDLTKNVPWLRLVGTPTPNTTGVFSNVAFIQRLDTRGGVAPAGPCTAPKTVAVDYTANYVFWAPK